MSENEEVASGMVIILGAKAVPCVELGNGNLACSTELGVISQQMWILRVS